MTWFTCLKKTSGLLIDRLPPQRDDPVAAHTARGAARRPVPDGLA